MALQAASSSQVGGAPRQDRRHVVQGAYGWYVHWCESLQPTTHATRRADLVAVAPLTDPAPPGAPAVARPWVRVGVAGAGRGGDGGDARQGARVDADALAAGDLELDFSFAAADAAAAAAAVGGPRPSSSRPGAA